MGLLSAMGRLVAIIGVVGVLALVVLLCSDKGQSVAVFLQWLNWPPFSWSEPDRPSPGWAILIGSFLEPWRAEAVGFAGLPQATPFSVQGSLGVLRGWRIPRKQSSANGTCTVMYLHGNAGNIALLHRVQLYELLAGPGLECDVVAFDYGSMGHSEGWWPTESTAVADTVAVWRALRPEERETTVIWGHSLGSGIAVGFIDALIEGVSSGGSIEVCGAEGSANCGASEDAALLESTLPRGLILEAPFISVPDTALASFAWLPAPCFTWLYDLLHSSLASFRFPSKDRISRVSRHLQQRVVVLHGSADDVVPYDFGKQLAATAEVQLHTFQRGHSDIVDDPTLPTILTPLLLAWSGRS